MVTVYTKLVEMSDFERAMLLGCRSEHSRKLGAMSLEKLTHRGEVCPARLSEKIFGHEHVCEAERRTRGVCGSCTRSFLAGQWPEENADLP